MFAALRNILTRWFGQPAQTVHTEAEADNVEINPSTVAAKDHSTDSTSTADTRAYPVPYDENLLERARTQWQFGDWQSLTQLHRDTLQHHPDRAKLALLAAAGRLQTDQSDEARQYIRLAKDWGVSKNLLIRILAAGVHNSLGRAAAIAGDQHLALQHFQSAIATGAPGSEARLLTQARVTHQYQQLDLSPAAIGMLSNTFPPVSADFSLEILAGTTAQQKND